MKRYKFTPAPYQIKEGKWKAKIVIEEYSGENITNIPYTEHDIEYGSREEALQACEEQILQKKKELGLV
jgi:hypothetical protein